MTYYYWNDCAMGNSENGFIQEEKEYIEPSKGFHFIGEADCIQDAIDYKKSITQPHELWVMLENPRFLAAVDKDYE